VLSAALHELPGDHWLYRLPVAYAILFAVARRRNTQVA